MDGYLFGLTHTLGPDAYPGRRPHQQLESWSEMKSPIWTQEKLAALTELEIKSLRNNAQTKNVDDLVALCDAELASRPVPPRVTRVSHNAPVDKGETVLEFHFVCSNDQGVTINVDDTFWTTAWLVSEDVVRRSMSHHPRVALHETRKEMSYRQGRVIEYRRNDIVAGGAAKRRIDFLVQPENAPMKWAGGGTGDKSFKRLPTAKKP